MRFFKLWLECTGRRLIEHGREMRRQSGQRGELDIGAILVMGIGMVFLAVGFIIFPIVTEATDDLLDYTYSANSSGNATMDAANGWPISDATFTGFTAVIGITPLLILVGFLSAAVFSMYLGVKMMKGGAGGTKLDLGTMLMLAIAMIFIAIALIILPVALDGIASVLHGDGEGISASYTGLEPILLVTPLLVLISFLSAAVVTGFFGMKRIAG